MARAEFLPFVEYFQIVGQHLRLREEGQPAEVQPPETGQKYSHLEQVNSGISIIQTALTGQPRNFKNTASTNSSTVEFQKYSHLEQFNSGISKLQSPKTG